MGSSFKNFTSGKICPSPFIQTLLLYTCGRKRLEQGRFGLCLIHGGDNDESLGLCEGMNVSVSLLNNFFDGKYQCIEKRSTLKPRMEICRKHEYVVVAFFFLLQALKLVKFGEIGCFTVCFQARNEYCSNLKTAL